MPTNDISVPYVISEERLRFNCKLNDLTVCQIQRDKNGSVDYWWPEGLPIFVLETNDGLLVFLWKDKEG